MKTLVCLFKSGIICFLLCTTVVIHAQDPSQVMERRVALVIGNGDYLHGPLANPVNDARSMARALRSVGFEVMLKENVSNKDELKKVIRDFGWELRKGGVGLFYYAGHGMQVDGFNFLVPVNAVINNEEEVEYECVDAGFMLAQMEAAQNRLNIVILDACRNNPFARSFRSTKQGLVSMNAPTGTLIAYATAPGKVASDGSGFNGLYTEALLNQIRQPDLKIEETFKNVRAEVLRKSDGSQTPWESSSLVGDFYFNPVGVNMAYYDHEQQPYEPPTEGQAMMGGNRSIEAEWKKTGKDIVWLFIDGQNIEDFEIGDYNDRTDELTLHYDGMTFILPDYKATRKHVRMEAEVVSGEPIPSYDPVISQPPNVKMDYSRGSPLDQITTKNPPGRYTDPNTKVRWRGTMDGVYNLFVNGRDISLECEHKPIGDDLYVFHPPSGLLFLLEDFVYFLDYRMHRGYLVRFSP
jgi:hypothetical protein